MKKAISVLTAIVIALSVCLIGLPLATAAETPLTLTGLCDGDNYSVYGNSGYQFSFDPDSGRIKSTGNQIKARLDYSKNMTDFSASMRVTGSTAGILYAGFGARIQNDKFTAGTFDTPGYMIIAKRSSSTAADANKLTVFVRYVAADNTRKGETTLIKIDDFFTSATKQPTVKMDLKISGTKGTIKVTDVETSKSTGEYEFTLEKSGATYSSGAFGFFVNGVHTIEGLSVTSNGGVKQSDLPVEKVTLGTKYNLYGTLSTDADSYTTTSSSIARGVLKNKTVTDFSAEAKMKVSESGELKSGIIFRTASVGAGTNDMEGYAAVLWKKTSTGADYNRMVLLLYKYGIVNGNYAYLGTIASTPNSTVLGYYSDAVDAAAGKELTLHLNVVGNTAELYFYGNTDPSDPTLVRKSQVLSADLTAVTDVEGKDETMLKAGVRFSSGGIGFYVSKGCLIDAMNLTVSAAEPLTGGSSEPIVYQGGKPAVPSQYGDAVAGEAPVASEMKHACISAPTVDDLAEYTADFSNYTFYSSLTSNVFTLQKNAVVSSTAGTKRAILDDVTVKGFHSTVDLKITEEGTLKSGIVFRVNNIDGSLASDGTLGANDIEGYAAVLYKTPGNEDDYSRVVLCIYKYGVAKGVHQYLGTVASKASNIPLKGYGKKIDSAKGQKLTLVVNLIDDTVSAYFYNTAKPELKSETLVADLNSTTDIENSTPSVAGVSYSEGAIGFAVTNYAEVSNFTLSEPIYPSTDVGDLGDLDSYTIYGTSTGVTLNRQGYFDAESGGTKKMLVNNLTVSDFTASFDTVIDNNGNLKTGILFRAKNVGNGADAQEGYAIVLVRNYATMGSTNPNRIDIVLFKWGLENGKQVYLGEVAREAYKSGASFMDGKMAGEELTFVVKVSGAALDATAYLKNKPDFKPITFSTNLKFAATKEKDGAAYFESGAIGLMLMNTVSDPLTHNLVRNFHIDDGSGVSIKSTVLPNRGGVSPITGEDIPFILLSFTLMIAAAGIILCKYYAGKVSTHGEDQP